MLKYELGVKAVYINTNIQMNTHMLYITNTHSHKHPNTLHWKYIFTQTHPHTLYTKNNGTEEPSTFKIGLRLTISIVSEILRVNISLCLSKIEKLLKSIP